MRRTGARALLVAAIALGVPAGTGAPATAAAPRGPHVAAIAPSAGPVKGKNVVVLRGRQLGAVTAVAFGSARSSKITHRSANQLDVAAPAHADGVVRVRLISSGGRSPSSVTYAYTSPPKLTFSPATEIDPASGKLSGLSCPTEDFCAAVDQRALVVIRSGRPDLRTGAPDDVSVSCGSPTFCVAQAESRVSFWDGTAWTPFERVARWFATFQWVSCAPGTSMCVGTSGGTSIVYSGTTWTKIPKPEGPSLGAVSCASTTFCVSATSSASWEFDGSAWHRAGRPQGLHRGTSDGLTISCPATTFCLAAEAGSRRLARFDGSDWRRAPDSPLDNGPSCASSTDCLLVDNRHARVALFDGTRFAAAKRVPGASGGFLTSACVPGGSCVAIDRQGQLLRHTSAGWSDTDSVPVTGTLRAISCPTVSWCMAVDGRGNAVEGAGSDWSAAQRIDDFRTLRAVSCSTRGFCVAIDAAGHAVTFRSGTWSSPEVIDRGSAALEDVACTSATRCRAVDSLGRVIGWDGSRWAAPKKVGSQFTGIDCPTPRTCLVTGTAPLMLHHGTWTKVGLPQNEIEVSAPTCLRRNYCVTGGLRGFHVWRQGVWSRALVAAGHNSPAVTVGCLSEKACVGGKAAAEDPFTAAFAGASSKLVQAFGFSAISDVSCVPGAACTTVLGASVRTGTARN